MLRLWAAFKPMEIKSENHWAGASQLGYLTAVTSSFFLRTLKHESCLSASYKVICTTYMEKKSTLSWTTWIRNRLKTLKGPTQGDLPGASRMWQLPVLCKVCSYRYWVFLKSTNFNVNTVIPPYVRVICWLRVRCTYGRCALDQINLTLTQVCLKADLN